MALIQMVTLLVLLEVTAGSRQCIGSDSKPVDWFIVYKLPKIEDHQHPLIKEGLGHFYMDVNNLDWTLSDVSLNATNQAIAYTLQQVYETYQSNQSMYVFYNDETPEKHESGVHGHTKGVVSFDNQSGYWLVHSLPRFPPLANETYSYPDSGLPYGQTFLCISLSYEYMDVIGELFQYNYPQIYDKNAPSQLVSPKMAAALNGEHVTDEPYNITTPLKTMGGAEFQAFAKCSDYGKDLYSAWLAPYYQDDMMSETWQNGVGKLSSYCNGTYTVENVQMVNISGESFKETKDHAKWAVTNDNQVTCIGDINRAEGQTSRGGGTVCYENKQVWSLFKGTITRTQECDTATITQQSTQQAGEL